MKREQPPDAFAPALGDRVMRAVLRGLSPGGERARLSIVIFHRVHAVRDDLFPDEVDASDFRTRIDWLRRWFNILPLESAVLALAQGKLPERALCVTFDDGYADNATVALPILRDLGVHATFFVATSFLDGGRMWNDTVIEAVRAASGSALDLSAAGLGVHSIGTAHERRIAVERLIRKLKYAPLERREHLAAEVASAAETELPSDLMMSSLQLRMVAAAGMTIGAHTRTHPILASVGDATAAREIDSGREEIRGIVRQPVTLFAYPNGKPDVDYRRAHVQMVRRTGFVAAVTTSPGAAHMQDDLHELPRFSPWDRSPFRYGMRLARNHFTPLTRASR